MILPHDYVNCTRMLWADSSGITHPLYPTKHTQTPFKIKQDSNNNYDFGGYQFISLDDIITQFEIAYVGENKIIPKIKRADVAFHAMRALQELSFDTFKSIKAQKIDIPASLVKPLPQD